MLDMLDVLASIICINTLYTFSRKRLAEDTITTVRELLSKASKGLESYILIANRRLIENEKKQSFFYHINENTFLSSMDGYCLSVILLILF
jgi:hypothetical protein